MTVRRVDCSSTGLEEIKVTELSPSLFGGKQARGSRLLSNGAKPNEIKAFLKLMSEAELHPGVTVVLLHTPEGKGPAPSR